MGCTLVRLERIAGSKRALHSSVVQWNGCRGERWWQQVCKKWPWSGLQSFQGYAASLPLAFKISQHFQLLRKGINLEFQLYLYLQMHLEVQYIKCTQQRKSEIIRATLFVTYINFFKRFYVHLFRFSNTLYVLMYYRSILQLCKHEYFINTS